MLQQHPDDVHAAPAAVVVEGSHAWGGDGVAGEDGGLRGRYVVIHGG